MRYLIFLFLLLASCNKYDLAPEVIWLEGDLRPVLQQLLEMALEDEICYKVEKEGFECRIREQMNNIKFKWVHTAFDTHSMTYEMEFCLKDSCPLTKIIAR